MTRPQDEDGVATVVALAMIAVLVFVAIASAGAVGLVLAQRRAQGAADLAALAAAQALLAGNDPCGAGRLIAERHDVSLHDCAVAGTAVLLTVEVALPKAFAGRTVRARARAGPDA